MIENQLETRPSGIAGNGVFALKNIHKGETVYVLDGERCSLDEIIRRCQDGLEEASDPLGIGEELYIDLNEFSRTFNHACSANTWVRGESELVALRDIHEGEEITFDYSTTMSVNEEKILAAGMDIWTCPCSCGTPGCRGIIDQFKTLPADKQSFYISNRFLPDFMLKRFG